MPDDKMLTLEFAREWDGNTSLRDYTSIDSAAAPVLANNDDCDLTLDGLTSLTRQAAHGFSKQKSGSLSLNGLTSLDDNVAEEFSGYVGHLGLGGLTSLSLSAARSLSKSVQFIDLAGLTSVSDSVADVLSKCKGRIQLGGLTLLTHQELAAKLAEEDDELHFPHLQSVPYEVAVVLSKTKARRLLLPSLKSITSFDLAWRLFLQDQDSDALSGLTRLSLAEADTIANYKGDIYLDNLNVLTENVAEALSKHRGILGLRGMNSLTDTCAEFLSRHSQGILILPPKQSKQVSDHFQRKYLEKFKPASQKAPLDGFIKASELQHGKFYECKVDSTSHGIENDNFTQLAIDATTTRRYVLFGAKHIYQKDPEFVRKLINFDFYFLFMEEYGSSKWNHSIREMILDETGLMLQSESADACFFDFKEAV